MKNSPRLPKIPESERVNKNVWGEEVLDLLRREDWIDAHRYGTISDIQGGEIGRIGNVHYFEKQS